MPSACCRRIYGDFPPDLPIASSNRFARAGSPWMRSPRAMDEPQGAWGNGFCHSVIDPKGPKKTTPLYLRKSGRGRCQFLLRNHIGDSGPTSLTGLAEVAGARRKSLCGKEVASLGMERCERAGQAPTLPLRSRAGHPKRWSESVHHPSPAQPN